MLKVYLACPYTHPKEEIRRERFEIATRTAGHLMAHGVFAFSPITHGHPIAQHSNLPSHWEYWQEHCLSFVSWADAMLVIDIPGTSESVGVQAEIALFRKAEKSIRFISPASIETQLSNLLAELGHSPKEHSHA